jgi:SAM-dependent methyltransferase
VTNFDMPHTYRVPDVPTVDDVVKALREIAAHTEPDREGAEFYRMANRTKAYRDAIAGFASGDESVLRKKYDYHEYWEGRYAHGARGAGGPTPLGREATFINDQIKKAVQEAGCETVLDVGCGSMVRWDKLPVKPENYKGCDVSQKAVEFAADRFPKAQFFVADITTDPLPEADCVIALDVLPHIKPEHFQDTVGKLFHTAKRLVILKVAMNVDDGYYQHNVPLPHEWKPVQSGKWGGPAFNIPDNRVAKLWIFENKEAAVAAA